MTRREVIEILDGTHPKIGRRIALVLHGLILLSALAISLETVKSLPQKLQTTLFIFEIILLGVFLAEYLLRLFCAKNPIRYAISLWGIVDLLSCVPALILLQPQLQAIRTLRLIRLVRLLKLFRSSVALDRLSHALRQVRGELTVFVVLAGIVLYVSAVGIYLFENAAQPEAFSSIPKSLWWAVASFTTVGYGDMYPITAAGRIFTTLVLFVGLGVVAVPVAIITTALLETQTTIKPLHPVTEDTSTQGDTNDIS